MAYLVNAVILTTYIYFAELTPVAYGNCYDRERQRFVYCSNSVRSSKFVYCSEGGLTTIRDMMSCDMMPGDTTVYYFINSAGNTPYGHKTIDYVPHLWVTGGCSGLFEVCGETSTTASSEKSSVAQIMSSVGLTTINHLTNSVSHPNKSTSSGRTATSSTKLTTAYSKSRTKPSPPVTESQSTPNLPVTESQTPPDVTVSESMATQAATVI